MMAERLFRLTILIPWGYQAERIHDLHAAHLLPGLQIL
jgi:hypothetical protein